MEAAEDHPITPGNKDNVPEYCQGLEALVQLVLDCPRVGPDPVGPRVDPA